MGQDPGDTSAKYSSASENNTANPLNYELNQYHNAAVAGEKLEETKEINGEASISTNIETNSEYFDLILFMKIIGLCFFFSFVQIAIPLGSDGQTYPVAFTVVQLWYIPWGVVNGNINYCSTLPMVPHTLLWTALIVAMIAQLILVVCFIFSTPRASYFMGLTRGIGLTTYTIIMMMGLIIFALYQDWLLQYGKASNDSLSAESERMTVHLLPVARVTSTAEPVDESMERGKTKSVSVETEPMKERQYSIGRMIDRVASIEASTVKNLSRHISEGRSSSTSNSSSYDAILTYSCACQNSIWRTTLRPIGQKGRLAQSSWELPILCDVCYSIITVFPYSLEFDFKIIGMAWHQALRILSGAVGRYLLFLFTEWLTIYYDTSSSPYGEVGLYIFFVVGLTFNRIVYYMVGLWMDMYKTGGISIQYTASLWITIYYFVYYRGLFVNVHSYGVFLCIKALHVMFELCAYQVRYSDAYEYWFSVMYRYIHQQMTPGTLRSLAMIAMGPPLDVNRQRTDIALGMRLYVLLFTSVSFILYFSFLRFGYNRQFYCLFRGISDEQYTRLMIFTSLSLAIELVVFAAANQLSKRRRGYSALSVWQRLLSGQFDTPWRAHVVLFTLSNAHIVVNYYLARQNYASLGDHSISCAT